MADERSLHDLEVEVEAEVELAASSEPADGAGVPPEEWQFDPADVEREEIGLQNLLGAVKSLEADD